MYRPRHRGQTRDAPPRLRRAPPLRAFSITAGSFSTPAVVRSVFATNGMETGLIGLKGSAEVKTSQPGSQSFTIGRYDSLYVPRGASIEITPGPDGCDLAEVAAPVEREYPVQFVAFKTVQADPGLHLKVGGPSAQRDLNILIGKNVEAGRIMAGVTFSDPGNWTSWPPHEHAAMLEEAYLYIDMPAPAFGLQLVYTDAKEPEIATIVREGDVVLMPQGTIRTSPPRRIDQLSVDDGRKPRARGSPVRRRQRAAGVRRHALRSGQRPMNWNSITVETVGEGIRRQMVTGDRLMMCRLQMAPHTITPVHSHPHEQITIIEQGRVRFHVDGADRIVSAGEILHFPSNVRHGATMLEEPVVLIDIFTPIREDFLSKNQQGLGAEPPARFLR